MSSWIHEQEIDVDGQTYTASANFLTSVLLIKKREDIVVRCSLEEYDRAEMNMAEFVREKLKAIEP